MSVAISALTAATLPITDAGDVPATDSGTTYRFSPAQLLGAHSPLDYGAAGNGSTDDLSALNSTIAAAVTGPSRLVWVPPAKTFKFSASPTDPSVPITFLVDGTLAPSSSATLGSNITVVVRPGGSLSPSGSAVLTVTGPLQAPPVRIFNGTGTLSFSGNRSIEYYLPQWWGVLGDGTLYSTSASLSAGASTITGLSSSSSFAAGQSVVVRSGGSRAQACLGSDSGWAALGAASSFSADATTHTSGSAGAKFDVVSSYVAGTEFGSFTFSASQDWSTYDEIRFDAKVASLTAFSKFPPGGLVLSAYNSSDTLVSRQPANGNLSPGGSFIRVQVPLDQQTPLSDVKKFTLSADILTNTSNRPVSQARADTGGSIAQTGVGFTLWVDNVTLVSDLYTTVASVPGSTSITLSTVLGAALPDSSLSNMDSSKAKGVYHDDTVPLAACLAAVPDFSEIVFTNGLTIPLTTFTVSAKQGLRFTGRTGAGSSFNSSSLSLPKFLYVGRPGQKFWYLNRSRGLAFSNLTWLCSGPCPPSAAVTIDMVGAGSVITSDIRFDRCYVGGPTGSPNFCGFDVSRTATSNCEFIRFRDVWVTASQVYPGVGTGFYIGGSFNAKSILYEYCSTGNCTHGWRTDGGSMIVRGCTADFNGIDFVINGGAEPTSIENCNFEYSGGCVSNASPYPVKVSNTRWSEVLAGSGSSNSLSGAFKLTGTSGAFHLSENKVFPSTTVTSPVLLDPATTGGTVLSSGNYYNYNYNLSNLWLANNGSLSRDDRWSSGGLSTQGELLIEQKLYAINASNAARHLMGRGTRRNNTSMGLVSIDEDGDGTSFGGWGEFKGGGLHLKKQVLTAGTHDLTVGNTIHDQVGGIVFLDASSGTVTVSITNPNDYRGSSQPATPIWEFKRIDSTSNVARISPYSRGQPVEGMDSSSWIYVPPKGNVRLACDGQNPTCTYWQLLDWPCAPVTDSWSSTVTLDWAKSPIHQVTLGGSTTLAFSNLRAGQDYTLILVQDGTGSRTVTWPYEAKFSSNGTAPTLTTTANKTDILRGFSDGTSLFFTSHSLNVAAVGSPPAAPVADFSGTPTTGTNSTTVTFTNTSTGTYTSSSWDFGDGGTSTSASPTHDYTLAGTYTVSLTVTGPGGSDNETKTGYIVISGATAPVADFSADVTTGAPPLTVTFTNLTSGSVDTYSWDFGDSGTSTSTSPSHIYSSAGTYTVALTATGSGGSDTETKTAYITVVEPGAPTNQVPPLVFYLLGDIPPGLSSTQLSGADLLIYRPFSEVLGSSFK